MRFLRLCVSSGPLCQISSVSSPWPSVFSVLNSLFFFSVPSLSSVVNQVSSASFSAAELMQ